MRINAHKHFKLKEMKIYVQSIEIETKEILFIKEAESGKHGFVIYLTGDRKINITESEMYNDYPGEKRNKNDRYRQLRKKVEEEWEKDKIDHIVLNL